MHDAPRIYALTLALMIAGLLLVLHLGLLPALLAGLLVYQIVEFGSRTLTRIGVPSFIGKVVLIAFVGLIVISALGLGASAFAARLTDGPESVSVLLQRMADAVGLARSYLPAWTEQYLPANLEEWQVAASDWLRENALHLSEIGKEAGIFIIHILIGMIIGAMVAFNPGFQDIGGPFSRALSERVDFISSAFSRIVFSQIRISALNTALTAIFLGIVLPMTGNPLPLTKTMIAVTFIAGLLPIIGNLISNTVIFLISLSVGPLVAVGSLTYLVVIHKLEYFFNAHIIGTQIRARAWELLISMVVMEAAFGVAGVVAAPIYYAYIKDELKARKLI